MEPQATQPVEGLPMPAASPDMLPQAQPLAGGALEAAPQTFEGAPNSPGLQGAAPLQAPVPQHMQTNPGPQVGAAPGALAADGTPAIADDTDLIEKEWVVKAKQIVERTKTDPYVQSKELNKIKAEYIKKRYNKEIKLPES